MSIVPETAKYAEVPFRVLTDLDLAYALSLGLVFWVRDKIKETYRQFGIDLARFQRNGGWLLPIPATLVVGPDGRVKARFVDPDFRHRLGSSLFCGRSPPNDKRHSSIASAVNHAVST